MNIMDFKNSRMNDQNKIKPIILIVDHDNEIFALLFDYLKQSKNR